MKYFILTITIIILNISCNNEDSQNPIVTEPLPKLATFSGQIGVNDNSTITTSDNALILCGNTGDNICIMKISASGSQIWRTDFIDGYVNEASGLAQNNNKDIFICGSTYRNAGISMLDLLLIKLNSSGDTVWSKNYGGAHDDQGDYIINAQDNNLLICGTSHSFSSTGSRDIYLMKINYDGDTIWTRTFPEIQDGTPYHLLQTNDGEYMITGAVTSPGSGSDLLLLKLNPDGTTKWMKTIGDGSMRWGFSTVEASNGDLVTCGKIIDDGLSQIMLYKTNAQGTRIWDKEFGESYFAEQGNAIQINTDGTYIITGGSYEEHSGQRGIVLLKVDQAGNQLCLKDFGHTLIDYGQNVLKDANDDNIITGEYNGKIFVTRTDHNCVFK